MNALIQTKTSGVSTSDSPIWTGTHTFSSTDPILKLSETDQTTNVKNWDIGVSGGHFVIRTRTDADEAGKGVIDISRGGTTTISNISFGNSSDNPTYTWLGTGNAMFNGNVNTTSSSGISAGRVGVTGSATPSNGMYLPATNVVGFSTNSTLRVEIDANGALNITNAEPRLILNESDQGADLKMWDFDVAGGTLLGRTRNDADNTGKTWLSVARGATTGVSSISLGNASDNPTLNVLGTGTATFGGLIIAQRLSVTGSFIGAGVNIVSPGTNRLGFATSSTLRVEIDANGALNITNTEPRLIFNESDQGTDFKLWDFDVSGGVLTGRTRTDADAAGVNWLSVSRGTTTAISNISLGNASSNPTYTFLGSGLVTVGNGLSALGGIQATFDVSGRGLRPTGTNLPTGAGINLPGAGRLGFSSNGLQSGEFDANGTFKSNYGRIQPVRVVTAAGNVTVVLTDYHIAVNKTVGAATTVNLIATPETGRVFTIDDVKGDAATNNITIIPAAGNIDGSATFIINTNYGSWTGYYTGSIWKTISSR